MPWFWWVAPFALATVAHLVGMAAIDLMDVDAAQYASISREMLDTGQWLQVHHRHADYLDKPPLLFWLSAWSFKLLGVSAFAYRLPSFLFTLLGTWATYRLGKLLYDEWTGRVAALVLYTCQAYFLINHDVRTDTLLANAVAVGTWQLALYLRGGPGWHVLGGFAGLGLAMLDKGPIGLMVPALALGADVAYRRDWRPLARPIWLLGLLLLVAMLAPMTWGLYQQFGWPGVRFYYWTQSFGRLTGESDWQDDSTYLFFTHTFLWSFLPWAVVAVYAVASQLLALGRARLRPTPGVTMLPLAGFVLPFLALSTSHYKLPHYIFVVFPFAALLTANALRGLLTTAPAGRLRVFTIIQGGVAIGLWGVAGLLATVVFPARQWGLWVAVVPLVAATLWCLSRRRTAAVRLLMPATLAIAGANLVMNAHFYPTLLTYQWGSAAARYVLAQGIAPTRVATAAPLESHALDFYTGQITPALADTALTTYRGWLLAPPAARDQLARAGVPFRTVHTFDDFHVTKLTLPFLNPTLRPQTLGKVYLLQLNH